MKSSTRSSSTDHSGWICIGLALGASLGSKHDAVGFGVAAGLMAGSLLTMILEYRSGKTSTPYFALCCLAAAWTLVFGISGAS